MQPNQCKYAHAILVVKEASSSDKSDAIGLHSKFELVDTIKLDKIICYKATFGNKDVAIGRRSAFGMQSTVCVHCMRSVDVMQ